MKHKSNEDTLQNDLMDKHYCEECNSMSVHQEKMPAALKKTVLGWARSFVHIASCCFKLFHSTF